MLHTSGTYSHLMLLCEFTLHVQQPRTQQENKSQSFACCEMFLHFFFNRNKFATNFVHLNKLSQFTSFVLRIKMSGDAQTGY